MSGEEIKISLITTPNGKPIPEISIAVYRNERPNVTYPDMVNRHFKGVAGEPIIRARSTSRDGNFKIVLENPTALLHHSYWCASDFINGSSMGRQYGHEAVQFYS